MIGGDNLPSPVRIGLTDLQNIGGASGPPGPPGSGTTGIVDTLIKALNVNYLLQKPIRNFYLVSNELLVG